MPCTFTQFIALCNYVIELNNVQNYSHEGRPLLFSASDNLGTVIEYYADGHFQFYFNGYTGKGNTLGEAMRDQSDKYQAYLQS